MLNVLNLQCMHSWFNTYKDSTRVIFGLTSKPDIQLGARLCGTLVSLLRFIKMF